MSRWWLLGLVGAPGLAWADPVSISAAVSWIAANWVLVARVVLVVASVYSSIEQRRRARAAQASQRAAYNSTLEGRSVTVLTAAPPWRIVYGRPGPVGGAIVAMFTTDKSALDANGDPYTKPDALRHLVIEFAHHECEAIHEIYLDGSPVGTLDGNGRPTAGEFFKSGTYVKLYTIAPGSFVDLPSAAVALVTSTIKLGSGDSEQILPGACTLSLGNTRVNNPDPQYPAEATVELSNSAATITIQKHLGTDAQTVDTYLNGLLPTEWDSTHRLRGACYIVVTLDLEEPRFQGGPPNFTADISGKKCYDPRSGLTVYTENNALCIRDFLTAPYGYGVDAAEIDASALTAAANACDELITLVVGATSTPNQPRFTLNGSFTTEDERERILVDMADSMAGVVTNAGAWFVRAGVWTAPVMTLNNADLAGVIEFPTTNTDYESLFNGFRGLFVPRGQATPIEFDSYQNAAFVAADGEDLWEDKDLPFTDNRARARNLSRIFVETNRLGQTITYPMKLQGIRLQPGDRVTVNNAENGLVAKTYRVVDWQVALTTAVMLTLRHDVAASYDLADAANANPNADSGLPNPWAVSLMAGVAATSSLRPQSDGVIVAAVTVSWDQVTSAYVAQGGWIRVRWRRAADNAWVNADVPGDSRNSAFVGPPAGTIIVIGVRAENSNRAQGPEEFILHSLPVVVFGGGALALVTHGTANAMAVFGNAAVKVGGTTGWNAGVYSTAALVGSCRLKFRVRSSTRDVLVGLNPNPTVDADYTGIDYGMYFSNAGAAAVYENGTNVASIGSYAAGAIAEIDYDGVAVRYYLNGVLVRQVAAPPGLALYVDSSFYQTDARIEDVQFVGTAPAQRGNLVDPGSWVIGSTGSQGNYGSGSYFGDMGNGGESAIVLDVAPDGQRRAIWQATSVDNLGTGDGDGGWESSGGSIPIDHTKPYVFTNWHKAKTVTGTNVGSTYLGCKPNSVADIATGAANGNPYFFSNGRGNFVAGRWYLHRGYVLPSSHGTTQHNMSGIWDAVTGEKIYSGVDFKWVSAQDVTYHRAFMYYTDTGNVDQFWGPRIDLCDGNEPSLDQLLQLASSISTRHLQPGAATATDFKSGGAGSWVSSPTGDAVVIGTAATGGSGSGANTGFTNNTGGAVTVQVDSTMFELDDAGTGGNPEVFLQYQINSGSFQTVGMYGSGGGASPGLGVGFAQIPLTGSESLTLCRLMGVTAANKTAQFSAWALRLTAILR